MFDIGWSELLLIGVVALIVIGPKELPGVLRAVGQWTGKIRRMAAEFQGQFQEAMREAEMADLKKQVDDISEQARSIGRFDPLAYEPAKGPNGAQPPAAAAEPAPGLPAPEVGAPQAAAVEPAPNEHAAALPELAPDSPATAGVAPVPSAAQGAPPAVVGHDGAAGKPPA